jgi:Tfp pilus assembly protein PilN
MKMIEINLLPKELRKKGKGFALSKSTLYFMSGGAALIIIMILITSFQSLKLKGLDKKIVEAQKKKEQLRESIQMVDAINELKTKILKRMSAIENLDKNRSTWIEVMQELSDRVPEYVWLTSFKEIPKTVPVNVAENPSAGSSTSQDTVKKKLQEPAFISQVTIDGYSFSINNLAVFMINLMRSNYFKNMELNFVRAEASEQQKIFAFQLSGDLLYSSEAQKEAKLKEKMREPETGS